MNSELKTFECYLAFSDSHNSPRQFLALTSFGISVPIYRAYTDDVRTIIGTVINCSCYSAAAVNMGRGCDYVVCTSSCPPPTPHPTLSFSAAYKLEVKLNMCPVCKLKIKIHFNTMRPSMPRSPKLPVTFKFSRPKFCAHFSFLHT